MTEKEERWQKGSVQQATQYYIAARFGHFAQLVPICGNLFHHAIEMYLKGALVPSVSVKDLKDKFRHNLKELWKGFKKEVSDPTLNRFDDIIDKLHKFEDIRYPDKIVADGATIVTINGPLPSYIPTPKAEYELHVSELDQLIVIIFEKASLNPTFFTSILAEHAREYLEKDNLVAAKLMKASKIL